MKKTLSLLLAVIMVLSVCSSLFVVADDRENLAAGKSYVISEQFHQSPITWGYDESYPPAYPDDGGELTDGKVPASDEGYSAAGWVGFNKQTPAQAERGYAYVILDLEAVSDITGVSVAYCKDINVGITVPYWVEYHISEDGESYKQMGYSEINPDSAPAGVNWYGIDFEASARFVMLKVYSYGWAFLGEIEVYGTGTAPVDPEPEDPPVEEPEAPSVKVSVLDGSVKIPADDVLAKLADGNLALDATAFGDAGLVAFENTGFTHTDGVDAAVPATIAITVDLGAVKTISKASLSAYKESNSMIALPSVKFEISVDGVNFYDINAGGTVSPKDDLAESATATLTADFSTRIAANARYVRAIATFRNGWVFLSEVSVTLDETHNGMNPDTAFPYADKVSGTAVGVYDAEDGELDLNANFKNSQLIKAVYDEAAGAYKVIYSKVNPWPDGHTGTETMGENEILVAINTGGALVAETDDASITTNLFSGCKWIARGLTEGDYLVFREGTVAFYPVEGEFEAGECITKTEEPEDPPVEEPVADGILVDGILNEDVYTADNWFADGIWQGKETDPKIDGLDIQYIVHADDDNIYLTIKVNRGVDFVSALPEEAYTDTAKFTQVGSTDFRIWLCGDGMDSRIFYDLLWNGEDFETFRVKALTEEITYAAGIGDDYINLEMAIAKESLAITDSFKLMVTYSTPGCATADGSAGYNAFHMTVCDEMPASWSSNTEAYSEYVCDEIALGGNTDIEPEPPVEDPINVALNKNVLNATKRSSYNAGLTDGVALDTLTYNAADWFGFYWNPGMTLEQNLEQNTNAIDGMALPTVDLAGNFNLTSVRVNTFMGNTSGICAPEYLKVLVSDDNETFTELAIHNIDWPTNGENYVEWIEFDLPEGTTAKYVRVEMKMRTTFVFINEIEVYGTAIPEDVVEPVEGEGNLALDRGWYGDTSAAGTYYGDVTDGIIDPDGEYDPSLWFNFDIRKIDDGVGTMIIDLGALYGNIQNVKAYVWPAGYSGIAIPDSITIYGSADGEEFVELGKITSFESTDPQWVEVAFEDLVTARYIKVDFAGTGTFWFIGEIEVNAKAAEVPPVDPEPPVEVVGEMFWLTHYNDGFVEGSGVIFTEEDTAGGWWIHVAFAPIAGAENAYEIVEITNGLADGSAAKIAVPEGGFVWAANYGNNYPSIYPDDSTAIDYTSPNCSDAIGRATAWKVGDKFVISGVDFETIPTSTPDVMWYDDAYVCTATIAPYVPSEEPVDPPVDPEPPVEEPKIWEDTYTVLENGNAQVDIPYGYTWTIDDIDGKIGGEDTTLITNQDAYMGCNPNWAITLYLEKQEDGSYVAIRNAIVGPGSAEAAGIEVDADHVAFVVHSSSSKPTDAEKYPNWLAKVVAMSVKEGDRFIIDTENMTVYAVIPGEDYEVPGDEPEIPSIGDFDGDGMIAESDVELMMENLVGSDDTLADADLDLDGNGAFDIYDCVLALQYIESLAE